MSPRLPLLPAVGILRSLAFLALLAGGLTGCSEESIVRPLIPPEPPDNPAIRAAAWTADVDREAGSVRIRGAARGLNASDLALLAQSFEVGPGTPELSILAGDVVDVMALPGSLRFSAVGEFTPGLVRVTFDVAIRNRIPSVSVVTPTFPTPPPGTLGILLIPIETVVTETPGSVSADGNAVTVELPNQGEVAPSVDFDGAPLNFFNDSACGPQDNDCYRYELFPAPLLGGGMTIFQTIGFDVEPTVSTFRARLLLAGDVEQSPVNAWGVWTDTLGAPISTAQVGDVVELQLCFEPLPGPEGADAVQLEFRRLQGAVALLAQDLDAQTQGTGSCRGQSTDRLELRGASLTPDRNILQAWVQQAPGFGIQGVGRVRVRLLEPGAVQPSAGGYYVPGRPQVPLLFDMGTLTVTGLSGANLPPVARAGSPYTVDVGATATLDGSGSTDVDGTIVSWTWGFSDGTPPRSGPQVDLPCAVEGTRVVTLTVVDDAGAQSSSTTTLSCEIPGIIKVYGVWTDGEGRPIDSAPAGSTVRLQICASERAEMVAFQSDLRFSQNLDSFESSDLVAEVEGVGECANPGGRDPVSSFTSSLLIDADRVLFQNFRLTIEPGTGRQGLGEFRFRAPSAGSLTVQGIVVVAVGGFLPSEEDVDVTYDIPPLLITP